MPYPDEKEPRPDWQRQIYNAWWNGYILGYPERFIDSYCETFHNGLDVDEKMEQARKGKLAVKQYVAASQEAGQGRVEGIRMGADPPISEEAWRLLRTLLAA